MGIGSILDSARPGCYLAARPVRQFGQKPKASLTFPSCYAISIAHVSSHHQNS